MKKNFLPMRIAKMLLLLLSCFFLQGMFTFSLAQPVSASVTLTNAPNHMSAGTCYVSLADSTGIARISVALRDRVADSTWFNHEFIFDQNTGLPSGVTWQRNGTEVTLGLGLLPRQPGWTGIVRLKDNAGTWSDPLEFVFQ